MFVMDRDSIPSHAAAKHLVERFYENKGSILVGTEMALPYLTKHVDVSAVVSIDSLLSIPEWNAFERVFSILIRMRSATKSVMAIQTRKPETPILDQAVNGNLIDFYRSEIDERKKYKYPPFATFITVSVSGTGASVVHEVHQIENTLSPYTLTKQSSLTHTAKNRYVHHSFIRLPQDSWPDEKLIVKLRTLPPYVAVTVDPESIMQTW